MTRVPRTVAFWIVGAVLTAFLAAAAAPTPLYGLYAARWNFGPLTLTAVFAVYAIALLGTLLTTGSWSDALGRRPVILLALGLQTAAMVLFVLAGGVPMLFAARILQGVATGLVTSAVAAALLDLQPAGRGGLGPLVNGVAPTVGLAVGALLSGTLVQYGPQPLRLIYWVLLATFGVLAAVVTAIPDPHLTRGRLRVSARVSIEPTARRPYLTGLPCIVAAWAVGGLYLSLGPSLVLTIADSSDRLLGGAFVATLCTAGAVACVVVRAWTPGRAMASGCLLLVVGATITIVAIAVGSVVVLFAGTAVAGAGFGTAFLGAFRLVAAAGTPARRGELLGAIYIAAYLAFSLPALLAGILAPHLGLRTTTVVYSVAVLLLAAAAALARRRTTRTATAPVS